MPLRFVPLPDAPLATLEQAVQILTVQRAYHDLNAAVEQYTAVVREPPLALVSCLSRTVSLLTLPWDDDVKKAVGAATAHPDKCDTELSRSEQQAFDRVVRRIDDLWSFRPGLDAGTARPVHPAPTAVTSPAGGTGYRGRAASRPSSPRPSTGRSSRTC